MFYQFTQLLTMDFIMLLYIRSRCCVNKANPSPFARVKFL